MTTGRPSLRGDIPDYYPHLLCYVSHKRNVFHSSGYRQTRSSCACHVQGGNLPSTKVIAAEMKEVVDLVVGGEETLCLPGRLEAFHLSFSPSGRLVRILGLSQSFSAHDSEGNCALWNLFRTNL